MATVRYIVNSSLRKIGRLGAGREPRVADQADVLAALQGMYLSWITVGAFGRLQDVIPLSAYVAGENQRVIRNPGVPEITLPDTVPARGNPLPYDQERVNYENVGTDARPPLDGAVVQIADAVGGQVETNVYDGTLRKWVALESLQLDDTAPLSSSDPEGLSAALAMEIGDTFGADIGPTTAMQASRFMTALTHHYSTPRRVPAGVYC